MAILMLERLESRRFFSTTIASVAPPSALSTAAATVLPSAIAQRSVFLTGNSMTDGVSYAGLAALLGSNGETSVTLGRQTGSGFTQYANLNLQSGYLTSGIDPARTTAVNPFGNYQSAFAARPWDVLTIQPHERRFAKDVYGKGTPAEHDEAELLSSMAFLRTMAASNRNGQVYVYSRAARRTDVTSDLTPTGKPFDYSAEWLRSYNDTATGNLPYFSRSAVQQFMPLLRNAQAADAATAVLPKVKLIPVGEAYYNVDRMIKAGAFEGTAITSMLSLYRDQSHPTPDVAAYVIALTFYSSITGTDPRGAIVPGNYIQAGSPTADPKVVALLQQAVYEALTSSAYAGYTTPLDGTTPPPVTKGSISGFAFNDTNKNGLLDEDEIKTDGKTVFLDADNDGNLDPGERSTVTAANGAFLFADLPAGDYHVRRVFPNGYTLSTPKIDVTVAVGVAINGVSVGSKSTATTPTNPTTPTTPTAGTSVYRGYVINDKNGNGVWDKGEPGVAGRTVWLDIDNDGKLDANEPKVLTGSNGTFEFKNLAAGKVYARTVLPTGVKQTNPKSNFALTATLTAGQVKSGQYFGTK